MKKIVFFVFLLIQHVSFSQDNGLKETIQSKESSIQDLKEQISKQREELNGLKCNFILTQLEKLGYPKSKDQGQVIEHSCMVLNYVEKHEQASWVYHSILPDIKEGNEGRSNDFRVDPLVTTGSTEEKDFFLKSTNKDGKTEYDGYGYDRGHLAPSADFRWNPKALSESYFYSNMSPQLADFNRGKWAELEGFVRSYVTRNELPVYLVTGGVLTDDLPAVERSINKVTIPKYYYKIVVDMENHRGIGFILPNQKCDLGFGSYAVTIDSIETLTNIDFFTGLSEAQEEQIEARFDYNDWRDESQQSSVTPLDPTKLPRKTFNTVQAKIYMDTGDKIKVCGTVVSSKKSKSGNVFLNLDRPFPDHIFSVSIWAKDVVNYSYEPHIELAEKPICVTGKVGNYRGVPSMNISKEEDIEFMEE